MQHPVSSLGTGAAHLLPLLVRLPLRRLHLSTDRRTVDDDDDDDDDEDDDEVTWALHTHNKLGAVNREMIQVA
jgi:hypothetical protein